ncbi:MAG: short-chain dehydrogenase/reductase [Elsteraceae bacterium]
MDLGLNGRWALITGGSKGIGRACAELLAAEGVNLILCARNEANLQEARASALKGAKPGVEILLEPIDIADEASAGLLAKRYGAKIDILVNNAGAIPGGRLVDVPSDAWRAGWDLKVFGTINLCRAFFTAMGARGKGVIVNVIGSAGEKMDANYIAGSAGNAALMALTRALGAEAPSHGMRVVGINPGLTATDRMEMLLRRRAAALLGEADRWRELVETFPFKRAATSGEIANAVAFLASDLSGYTTGTILTIDGGQAHRS